MLLKVIKKLLRLIKTFLFCAFVLLAKGRLTILVFHEEIVEGDNHV